MAQMKKREGVHHQEWSGPKRKRSAPHKHNKYCDCADKVKQKKTEEFTP